MSRILRTTRVACWFLTCKNVQVLAIRYLQISGSTKPTWTPNPAVLGATFWGSIKPCWAFDPRLLVGFQPSQAWVQLSSRQDSKAQWNQQVFQFQAFRPFLLWPQAPTPSTSTSVYSFPSRKTSSSLDCTEYKTFAITFRGTSLLIVIAGPRKFSNRTMF